jgi:hypothetical protein
MKTKAGCKSVTQMALTQFSGFSGKPIDILASQDVKNKELTVDQRPFFKLYLVL